MFIMIGHSIKRLLREGGKSLSVPLIAFVLVILINLLGGIRAWLETQYEDTMENFPIVAVVSDLTGDKTENLNIEMRYIDLFLDPDVHGSLMRYTGEMTMRRVMENAEISGHDVETTLIGITNLRADISLSSEYGTEVTFFDGFDEQAFITEDLMCIISEDLLKLVEGNILNVSFSVQMPDTQIWEPILPEHLNIISVVAGMWEGEPYYNYFINRDMGGVTMLEAYHPEWDITTIEGELITVEAELKVAGTVHGAGYGLIFSPFWTVNALAEELTGLPPFTESLSVTVKNNSDLSDFKGVAAMSFSRVNPVHDNRPFAMAIHDLEFYETLEPLRQNIIVVDVATPFIYILSIAVGFLTSVLLTRRRKAEFAIMRSIGVNKWVVFTSALLEQALLSVTGTALGFALVAAIWNYASITRPAVFLACYLIGAIFAATTAAGTNVMKVLRDRKE